MNTQKISAVPTNIITGFLGVGKTSTILHLLQHKPAYERWAVLVNEFGELGVDGSLFQGQQSEGSEVFIREVPGGCMCCAAGVPMQSALNQLLIKSHPHRLLIEPTGLGHPQEVLQTLSSEHYQGVLDIQKVLTLVDARKLTDRRYTEHETFNQQIAIADVVIGNKQDLYAPDDQANLEAYIKTQNSNNVQILFTEQGMIDLACLQGTNQFIVNTHGHHHHHHESTETTLLSDAPIPEAGYLCAINQGEGFISMGWRFISSKIFERSKLLAFFQMLDVERMKAVFITEQGVFGYNLTSDGLTETELNNCKESRIEIIALQAREQWEEQLLACIST
ncbi:GTP-binding protein [Candidatus Albibeggiatoa sp. nov. NOAA]|uniref:CobW family GTP-binding protein n=1 Tax=Candidatus Albibeggiatoa sp. nov. NOAA TaxID=3162724 RepID=UPI003303C1E5|nr:GTP-binding protein [Thiotrichaceae bacterium]